MHAFAQFLMHDIHVLKIFGYAGNGEAYQAHTSTRPLAYTATTMMGLNLRALIFHRNNKKDEIILVLIDQHVSCV